MKLSSNVVASIASFSKKVRLNRSIFFLFWLIFSLSTFLIYFKLWRSYFTQDEWYYFGLFNQFVNTPLGFVDVFIQQFTKPNLYGIHFTPLWNSLFLLEYQFFGLKYQAYALLSMLLHSITALLVAIFTYRLTKSYFISFISGFYFTVTYSLYEAITWANTNIQSQSVSIIIIIVFVIWIKGLVSKNSRYLLYALILLFFGLLIKETIAGMFLLLLLTSFLYGRNSFKRRSYLYVFISMGMYLVIRFIIPLILKSTDRSIEMASSIPLGLFDIGPHLFRILIYPFKALMQQFVTPEVITFLAEKLAIYQYPNLYGQNFKERGTDFLNFVYSAGSDMVMILLTIPTIVLLWLLYRSLKMEKNKNLLKAYIFSLAFVVTSILPLIPLVPWLLTLFRFVTYIESRHFYLIAIGMSILLSLAINQIFNAIKRVTISHQKIKVVLLGAFSILVLLFFVREIYLSRTNVTKIVELGQERRMIVDYIKAVNPVIQTKSIFYITSNRQYFGLAALMVPFQTNFGYTLLNVYQPVMHYDSTFYTTGFLIEKGIDGQDYREEKGKGFGYFINGKDLLLALNKNHLSPTNVYSFYYDGATNIIQSTTEDIRKRINQELIYESMTSSWPVYFDSEDSLSLRYPSDYTIQKIQTDSKIDISYGTNGENLYSLSVYKSSIGEDLEAFVDDYIKKNSRASSGKSWIKKEEKITFSNLQNYNAIIVDEGGKTDYFFYHPKTFSIIQITENNIQIDHMVPLDEFFWCIGFN